TPGHHYSARTPSTTNSSPSTPSSKQIKGSSLSPQHRQNEPVHPPPPRLLPRTLVHRGQRRAPPAARTRRPPGPAPAPGRAQRQRLAGQGRQAPRHHRGRGRQPDEPQGAQSRRQRGPPGRAAAPRARGEVEGDGIDLR
ncbi:hypothetical protein DFJ73DRAFT_966216, partial [Zopfochytrium polystomum]